MEQQLSEHEIIKSIKNAVLINDHISLKTQLSKINISDTEHKTFFHKGHLLHITAQHCDIEMLEIIKLKYLFCIQYLKMPIISANKRHTPYGRTGQIINKEELNQIPKKNMEWLIKNNCLNEQYKNNYLTKIYLPQPNTSTNQVEGYIKVEIKDPTNEKEIINQLKDAIRNNDHIRVSDLLNYVNIENISNKAFFHYGTMLYATALHSDINMLEILKRKYIFTMSYFEIPKTRDGYEEALKKEIYYIDFEKNILQKKINKCDENIKKHNKNMHYYYSQNHWKYLARNKQTKINKYTFEKQQYQNELNNHQPIQKTYFIYGHNHNSNEQVYNAMLKLIPPENMIWLVKNNCIDKKYDSQGCCCIL